MPLDHECPVAGTSCNMCPTISDDMRSAMLNTWDSIGADYFQAMADGEDEVTCGQSDVIEMVLDCDRLEQYGPQTPEFKAELDAFRNHFTREQRWAIAKLAFPEQFYCA